MMCCSGEQQQPQGSDAFLLTGATDSLLSGSIGQGEDRASLVVAVGQTSIWTYLITRALIYWLFAGKGVFLTAVVLTFGNSATNRSLSV